MDENGTIGAKLSTCLTSILLVALTSASAFADDLSITPASMPRVGTVDQRYQSYNIEMIEVTGGEFWKPYGPERGTQAARPPSAATSGSDAPANKNSDLFQYRPPIDLTNTRLRRLASALAPAYLRVSGTWANTTHFSDSEAARAAPPPGFKAVLTRQQWREVIDFSQAVDARIVISFAVGLGNRDKAGIWTSDQARQLLDYTRMAGGSIAAAEFMNEPNLVAIGGLPAEYDSAAYERDFKVFHAFVKQAVPEMMILGPGTINEASEASELLAASSPGIDAVSYHYYGALSERCAGTATPESALTEAWLSGTDQTLAFYRNPSRPI